ncbi:endonuclease domain-containing protein [Streptomyces sp. NBC_00233]|uniref:endonuclease domain-containing protein n=1 Tax=Streptomyces sp. NBC_00233 TaxID=2975686 RepID=UPI0022548EC2|nr:endonuclease domain-containing protein [Streptomyces sp. NBC_00233]MCX5233477.1 endonuclease VII domain-containing protein [Streptomyces sp. NBC_00233]
MSERVIQGRRSGLISLGAADALWAGLTGESTVPTAAAAFTCSPADARVGYALLGVRVVAAVKAGGGQWGVAEAEVRRAAVELNAVEMDRRDLVRVGPFRGVLKQEHDEGMLLRWRWRIAREMQEPGDPGRVAQDDGGRLPHLAGIDWRRMLVEQTQGREAGSWWLPRAVVRLLDAAEHAERQWLQAVRQPSETVTEPPFSHGQAQAADGRETTSADCPAATLRLYDGELKGQLYSAVSRKPGISGKVAGWACAVCRTAPAAVLDHCHEHGYVRAPVCRSCNTQERPDHLYSNDIRVAGHYTRLFDTDVADWLPHWHRCSGCRARTTLPLPHLAAWTAHIACRPLRPAHRAIRGSRGRKPCGVLRVSWTGSQNAPRSCLLTVAVDFCPSGEHRVLARVPYREAVGQFRTWLAETAPAVAAAAGPDRLDGLPARSRPVIADTSSEGLALF